MPPGTSSTDPASHTAALPHAAPVRYVSHVVPEQSPHAGPFLLHSTLITAPAAFCNASSDTSPLSTLEDRGSSRAGEGGEANAAPACNQHSGCTQLNNLPTVCAAEIGYFPNVVWLGCPGAGVELVASSGASCQMQGSATVSCSGFKVSCCGSRELARACNSMHPKREGCLSSTARGSLSAHEAMAQPHQLLGSPGW